MMPWRAFLARASAASGLFGLAMFAAIRLATADPGGPTRDELTFAGTLRNADGSPSTDTTPLRFVFRRGAATAPACDVTTDPLTLRVGAFTVPVPIGRCPQPRSLFDGEAVTYEVFQGTSLLTERPVNVTPVPYARFADQAGVDNDCPAGYQRVVTSSADGFSEDRVRRLCILGPTSNPTDEVVRVGSGATAFWIDRFEASVRDRAGAAADISRLSANGQWYPGTLAPPLLARSVRGVSPAIYVTWFQAQELCRASGKRLPTGEEWLAAASGTVDSATNCNVSSTTGARVTSAQSSCVSAWGAVDMIGNLWEWTVEWDAGVGQANRLDSWPSSIPQYNGDGLWNVASRANPFPAGTPDAGPVTGIPSSIRRGGDYQSGAWSGVFAWNADVGPSHSAPSEGFRCVVPR